MANNEQFAHVYWLGGSPCAGKTSIALQLADEYGLQTYICDERFSYHLAAADPVQEPVLSHLDELSWEEIFMTPVEEQLQRTLGAYQEEFPFILADLAAMQGPVIAEGAALLPQLVAGVGRMFNRAAWIIPTADFQRETYARREWIQGILAQTSDPGQAFENWMARDVAFADHVAAQAEQLGGRVLVVDGEWSIEDNAKLVAGWLGLPG